MTTTTTTTMNDRLTVPAIFGRRVPECQPKVHPPATLAIRMPKVVNDGRELTPRAADAPIELASRAEGAS
ncbi:hypothetical protein LX36DRAFT_663983 [Colletotrichum falcatum]|nr:hypothetical protein LX36DRAFT_663983 [Colletotrichum falcatum]